MNEEYEISQTPVQQDDGSWTVRVDRLHDGDLPMTVGFYGRFDSKDMAQGSISAGLPRKALVYKIGWPPSEELNQP